MERVTGLGGFFFRAPDPAALRAWYVGRLGVAPVPTDPAGASWRQEAGATACEPFPEDTGHFRDPAQRWMINFRVRDLEAMVHQRRNAGVPVEVAEQVYPYGRFARLADPEGNPIELWQPAGAKPAGSGGVSNLTPP
jgi:glyoxylase I family protein